MSLDYASEHLTSAIRMLATGEQPLGHRLQEVWNDHVQMLWMKPCLTVDLLRDFRDLWHRYTAPSNDRPSTTLRSMTKEELEGAVEDLLALSTRSAVAASQAPSDVKLATLGDLA